MKPMSDLCWVCQQNSVAIMRAANTPESAKCQVTKLQYYNMGGIIICIESQVLKDAEEHLRLATQRTIGVLLRPQKKCLGIPSLLMALSKLL